MAKINIPKVFGFCASLHIIVMAVFMIFPLGDDLDKIFLYIIYLAFVFISSIVFLVKKQKALGLGMLYSILVPLLLFVIVQILVVLAYRGYI